MRVWMPRKTLAKITVNGWPDQTLFVQVVGQLLRRTKGEIQWRKRADRCFRGNGIPIVVAGKLGAALRLENCGPIWPAPIIFSLRCAYPIQGFNRQEHSEMFLKICTEHNRVIPHESYTELAGEENRLRNITHLQQRAQGAGK